MALVLLARYGDHVGRPLRGEVMVSTNQGDLAKAHVKGNLQRDEGNGVALVDAHRYVARKLLDYCRLQEGNARARAHMRDASAIQEQRQFGAVKEFGILLNNKPVHCGDAGRPKASAVEQEVDLVKAKGERPLE